MLDFDVYGTGLPKGKLGVKALLDLSCPTVVQVQVNVKTTLKRESSEGNQGRPWETRCPCITLSASRWWPSGLYWKQYLAASARRALEIRRLRASLGVNWPLEMCNALDVCPHLLSFDQGSKAGYWVTGCVSWFNFTAHRSNDVSRTLAISSCPKTRVDITQQNDLE